MSLPVSPTGWLAVYQGPRRAGDGIAARVEEVVGWGPNGEALVVSRNAGARVPAADLPHFMHLMESENLVAGVTPGQGWSVGYESGATPDLVVAWMTSPSGYTVPVVATAEGYAERRDLEEGEFLVPPGVAPEESPYRPQPDAEEL